MNIITRIIGWIDQGYDEAATRSNHTMGAIIAITGLLALAVDVFVVKVLLGTLAASVIILFGWRMILWFKREAEKSDRKNNSGR